MKPNQLDFFEEDDVSLVRSWLARQSEDVVGEAIEVVLGFRFRFLRYAHGATREAVALAQLRENPAISGFLRSQGVDPHEFAEAVAAEARRRKTCRPDGSFRREGAGRKARSRQ